MSFNTPQNDQYINIKLTDEGRHQISLGKLRFSKLVMSDREIDYSIDYSNNYSITSNKIISPIDCQPNINDVNLDGSSPFILENYNVTALKKFYSAQTNNFGIFSGNPNHWTFQEVYTSGSIIQYTNQTWGGYNIDYTGSPYRPSISNLVFIPWLPAQYSASTLLSYPTITSGLSYNGLWYKVISADTGNSTFAVDRPIPDLGSISHTLRLFFYPDNAIDGSYGSGSTQNTPILNMNIIRTYDIPGTNTNTEGISGYTHYGSIEYAGTKKYLGFGNETPALGIIHYTNQYTANTFGEQLVESTVELHTPFLMWHKVTGYTNGNATNIGLSCYDRYGSTHYDPIAKTTYRDLRDGVTSGNTIIGRVYHKLKLIAITDQEILNALSYKSNRNYTYPEHIVELSSHSASNVPYYSVSGLCESGKTYFVTTLFENETYGSSTSFGYAPSIHCGYIKQINGENDVNGRPKFLKVKFPSNSFPYMRNDSGLSDYGTGWNANSIQILVNEQSLNYNYDINSVPATGWTRVSDVAIGGNGVYLASDAGDNTIDPNKLNAHEFIISRQDVNSGSTYVLYSGCTSYQSELNFGDECFFFGTINTGTMTTNYYSSIVGVALPGDLVTSTNSTFDILKNDSVYISEIAVLDDNNNVVAVGKPTNPLRKKPHDVLAVQLRMEF